MPILAGMVTAGGGRFVPPLNIGRSGLGLAAGQFRITDASYASYNYTLGGTASRSGDLVTLPGVNDTGTVQVTAPKGITSSAVVNVGRAAYTYHDSYHHNPVCASHFSKGQCAGWKGSAPIYSGSPLNPGPASYTNSEGEWWRIW
jgi:hypothetical protein